MRTHNSAKTLNRTVKAIDLHNNKNAGTKPPITMEQLLEQLKIKTRHKKTDN
jgi:hypothetical protein